MKLDKPPPSPGVAPMNLTLHVHRPRYDPVGGAVPPLPAPPPLSNGGGGGVRRLLDPADTFVAHQSKRSQPPAAGERGGPATPDWLSRPAPNVDMPPLFAQDLQASLQKRRDRARLASQSIEAAVVAGRSQKVNAASAAKLQEAADTLSGTAANDRPSRQHQHNRQTNPSSSQTSTGSSSAGPLGASADHLRQVDALLRDLLKQLTQKPEEHQARLAAMSHIEQLARSVGLHVGVYGSSRTGVVLPESDLDLCVAKVLPDTEDPAEMRKVVVTPPGPRRNGFANPEFVTMLRVVRRSRQLIDVLAIAHARVPIIKCHFAAAQVDVDISFTTDGIITSHYLQTAFAKPEYILARPLILLVKLLLRGWNLHDPKDGGVGSFVVSLMMLWYLTVVDRGHWTLPDDHPHSPTTSARRTVVDHRSGSTSAAANRSSDVNEHLANEPGKVASLLIGFLQYYGTQFPYRSTGVDLTQLASFEKTETDGLHFVNPIAPSQNAASAASTFGTHVKHRFAEAARLLAGMPTKARHSRGGGGLSAEEAVSKTFAKDEDSQALWSRWSSVEYDAFKRRAAVAERQQRTAAKGSSATHDDDDGDFDVVRGGQNSQVSGHPHKAGAFFKSVILSSPGTIPQVAPAVPPPPLHPGAEDTAAASRRRKKSSRQLQRNEDHDEAEALEAPTRF